MGAAFAVTGEATDRLRRGLPQMPASSGRFPTHTRRGTLSSAPAAAIAVVVEGVQAEGAVVQSNHPCRTALEDAPASKLQ